MNKMLQGIAFVLLGTTFLLVALSVTGPSILWAASLGTSVIFNLVGTVKLVQYLKNCKKEY
ncbi:hypothetical protein [Bacillus suaedae]|uniref:Uncharacterized protein n=1 Tax=Halalkalibacter suaedae TaxID=2822140 RepID=A0A940WTR6_9BACI|nr:hypothetical protein [Bacillus suaedae]MBP3951593.1 hypothetical protein [Bacillus suaedae]